MKGAAKTMARVEREAFEALCACLGQDTLEGCRLQKPIVKQARAEDIGEGGGAAMPARAPVRQQTRPVGLQRRVSITTTPMSEFPRSDRVACLQLEPYWRWSKLATATRLS